jgi:hypothetical protein
MINSNAIFVRNHLSSLVIRVRVKDMLVTFAVTEVSVPSETFCRIFRKSGVPYY